jgi:PGF-pre-PGF domain-containing protein
VTDKDSASTTIRVTGPDNSQTTSGNVTTYTFSSTGQVGSYSVLLTATDNSGNVGTATATFTVVASSSGTGGGGGGGGAATPAESVKETKTINVGSQGATVTLEKSADHGVLNINIQVNNPVNNVQVSVEKLDSKPASIAQEVSGTVFRYLEITKSGTTDENIKTAKIRFKVEKSWLTDNNIDVSTVRLNRFSGGAWQELVTRAVDSDTTSYTFESDTPGFSTFAITGKQVAEEEAPAQPSVTTEEAPIAEAAPTEELPSVTGITQNIWVIVGIVVAAVVGIAVYAARSGKRKFRK